MAAVRDGAARGDTRRDVLPDAVRRSVVPDAAGRSVWLAAVWTGVGAAVVCATIAIVAVAVSWLPVSGASGHTGSAIRAGLLTFLAALHGGITVDGTSAQFVPLGMTFVVGLAAWRAGAGLADAANSLDEQDAARLAIAAGLQAASFTVTALVIVPFAHLGTSSAPVLGVAVSSLLLFAVVGGISFVRSSPLRDWCAERIPSFVGPGLRAGVGAALIYLCAGAVVAAGSLVMHASRVEELSRQVGGGWGGVPILLLGVLAAPNAAIAGSAYAIGPGFTVGSGTSVGALSTTHGLLPAFPLLGGVPAGHGATWYVWLVIVVTPLAAATAVARTAVQLDAWPARLRHVGIASAGSAMAWLVLAWQGGGGIGAGRLAVVGASPWQIGGVVLGELAALALVELSLYAAWRALRHRDEHRGTALGRLAREPAAGPVAAPSAVLSTKVVGAESNGTGSGNLDGSSSGNDSGKADGMGKLAG